MSSGGVGMSASSSSSSGANYGFGVGLAGGASTAVAHQGQGVAALLVMLAVLCFMFAYCCWGAPFCRSLCRRHCYCCTCCRADDFTDSESGGFGSGLTARQDQSIINTPTIILLPHGRTFVVHGRIFTQLQADNTGLDLVELGESVMRAQRATGSARHHHQHRQLQDSQGSIIEMDAETPSKDSMGSIGCFPPPTYESIYGKDEEGDLPPSYSDILLHRFANLPFELDWQEYSPQRQAHGAAHHRHRHDDSKEELDLRVGPRIISNPIAGSFGNRHGQAYASRSLPRRNPSLISNPLDGYYLDNELAGLHRASLNQRRRSAAAEVTTGGGLRPSSPAPGPRIDDEPAENARTNSDELARAAEIILGNRFASSRSQASRSQNDLMNSRNIARSDSRRAGASVIYQRRSEESLGLSGRAQASWNASEPDVRYEPAAVREEERVERPESSQASEDEENAAAAVPSNFQALADIRESRV